MKVKITLLMLIVGAFGFSQSYTYTRINYQDQIMRMKGKLTISDTLVSIYTENVATSHLKVEKTMDAYETKKYRVLEIEDDVKVRLTFYNPTQPTRQLPIYLLYESKDEFSDTYGAVLYYLKEIE